MYRIEKEFHFSASHQLNNLPEDHQCARLHGHNYILKVRLVSETLDDVGFVLDYGELSFVKNWVDHLDHRHLNDLFTCNPTSENICKALYEQVEEYLEARARSRQDHRAIHVAVGLSETPKTWAWYTRSMVAL